MIVITDSANFNKFAQAVLQSNQKVQVKFNNNIYIISSYNADENVYSTTMLGSNVEFNVFVDDNYLRSSTKNIIKPIGEVTFNVI